MQRTNYIATTSNKDKIKVYGVDADTYLYVLWVTCLNECLFLNGVGPTYLG